MALGEHDLPDTAETELHYASTEYGDLPGIMGDLQSDLVTWLKDRQPMIKNPYTGAIEPVKLEIPWEQFCADAADYLVQEQLRYGALASEPRKAMKVLAHN